MSEYVDLLARVAAPTGEGREVTDPATGETFGLVREQTVEDLDAAVAAAARSQAEHAPTSKRALGPLRGLPCSRDNNCASASPSASMRSAARSIDRASSRSNSITFLKFLLTVI